MVVEDTWLYLMILLRRLTMPNDNPLDGAEDYCAVEGTDPAIRLAYYDSWLEEHDKQYRAMWREAWQILCDPTDATDAN
jgi:hypothetical protein